MKNQSAPDDTTTPVAHTIPEAARIAGLSTRSLRYAVERGELVVRYPTSRPVILHADLLAFLADAPTARAAATGRTAGAVTS
jgi:hypothetical protein